MLRCPVYLIAATVAGLFTVVCTFEPAFCQQSPGTQEVAEKESLPPLPPFTIDQLELLIRHGVSSLDILDECESRGFDFLPDQEAVDRLKRAGADPYFLNEFFHHSKDETLLQLAKEFGQVVKEENWEKAISICNKIIVLVPRFPVPYRTRAMAKAKLGQFKDAIEDLQIYAHFNAGNSNKDVWIPIAKLALECQQLNQADFTLTRYLEMLPVPDASATLVRGQVRQAQMRYREAIQDFRTTLTLVPVNPEPYGRLAFLLASVPNEDLQDFSTAKTLSETAVRLLKSLKDPGTEVQVSVHLAVAAVAARLEKFDDAAEALRKAIAIDDRPEWNRYLDDVTRKQPISLPPEDIRRTTLDNLIVSLHSDMVRLPAPPENEQGQPKLRPFLISRHEVTRQEWAAVMGEFPPDNPDLPMDFISYQDVQIFLERLNRRIGSHVAVFRLPTEQEWEYAARGDGEGEWFFGNDVDQLGDFAWYAANSEQKVHPISTKKPNSFGLYDVYGNVAELCDPVTQMDLPDSGADRSEPPPSNTGHWVIARGGNFTMTASSCRTESSIRLPQRERLKGVGFRLAASVLPDLKVHIEKITQPPEGFDRAIEELRRQIASARFSNAKTLLNNRLIALLYVKIMSDLEEKRYRDAIVSLHQILEIEQSAGNAWAIISRINLAWIYATCELPEVRNPEEAIHQANQALGLQFMYNPNNRPTWEVYSAMAAAHAERGEFDKAIQRENQAIPLAPDERKEELRARLKSYESKAPVRSGTLLIDPFKEKD